VHACRCERECQFDPSVWREAGPGTGCSLTSGRGSVRADVQMGSDPQVLQHVKQVLHVLDQEVLYNIEEGRARRVSQASSGCARDVQIASGGKRTERTRSRPSASEPLVNWTQRSMADSATRNSLDAELSTRRNVSPKPTQACTREQYTRRVSVCPSHNPYVTKKRRCAHWLEGGQLL
jgi:hypothetical protein